MNSFRFNHKVLVDLSFFVALAALCSVRTAYAAGTAGAPSAFGPDEGVKDISLSKDATYQAACKSSKFYVASRDDLLGCYGASSQPGWDAVISAGAAYEKVGCAQDVDTTEVAAAKQKLSKAKAALDARRIAHRDALSALEIWQSSRAGNEQKLIDATKTERDTSDALEEAEGAVKSAQDELDASKKKERDAREAGFRGFQAAVSAAESTTRSEANFEALLRDQDRRVICLRVQSKLTGAYAGGVGEESKDAAARAHQSDTLRKSQGTASATTTTSSLIENPGSPDKVAYSILTALGADSKTTGTQSILNLNVSSLLWPTDEKRLKQPVWQRNLFIRGAFPLTTTDKVPQTGAGAASAGSPTEVSRFSLLAGGSFMDESDTRLPSEQDCYKLVLAYVPFPQTREEAAARSEERRQYYDVCARITANKTRLAWRGGMGFYTPNNQTTPKTRPELAVGALVWGPSSHLYLNFVYQGILRPDRVDNFGAGFSFAGNVDGAKSGVDATLRVGLDYLFLFNYAHTDKATDWEMRIDPTIRGKLFGNSIGTVAVGPRFLGSKLDSPGLMATLALSYDADTLVDSLLAPSASKTDPGK